MWITVKFRGDRGKAAQPRKEIAEQLRTFLFQNPRADDGGVVKGHHKQVGHRPGTAGLGVPGAVDHPVQPRVDDGPGAHRAGLQRHIQLAAAQPPAVQGLAGLPDAEHLGVGQRVLIQLPAVVGAGNHLVVPHDDRPDRDFSQLGGLFGFQQRLTHPVRVLPLVGGDGYGHRVPPLKKWIAVRAYSG